MNFKRSILPSLLRRHGVAICIAGGLPWTLHAAKPNFEAQTIDPNIIIGYGLAVGDVDGDGDQDILLADRRDFWWYENPSWKKQLFHTFHEGEKRTKLRDNVCIAARDIDGDGKVEVAVGGNWNPGNTVSEKDSGSVHFLGSLGKIKPVRLPHEPTTHRMRWIRSGEKSYSLVVLPLHGRGNKGGAGENGSTVFAYHPPADPSSGAWKTTLLSKELHKTHNFDSFAPRPNTPDHLVLGGAEGARHLSLVDGKWLSTTMDLPDMNGGAGEIRYGTHGLLACIEPIHGNTVAVYQRQGGKEQSGWVRTKLDDSLAQGHALAVADFLGTGSPQVIAGWRNQNKDGKVGIKLYAQGKDGKWTTHLIDDNKMACEDFKVVDLNKDGKLDIVACGRATRNVVIYWNK